MKIIVTIVISCESNDAMDRFLVLKPPVAAILNAWLTASKSGIPDAQRARKDEAARVRYTAVMIQTTFVDLYLYPSFERDESSRLVSLRR